MRRLNLAVALVLLLTLAGSALASSQSTTPMLVSTCTGPNAESVEAVDGSYVYDAWIGCNRGIGFARSTDGGKTFGPAQAIAGSSNGRFHGWDPAVAVAPDGTVYVAYMMAADVTSGGTTTREMAPVVAVSTNHGASFIRQTRLPVPAGPANWGDRDFIAVGPDGAVYVTWDYGPRADQVKLLCSPGGSCAYAAGDFNAVVQKSVNRGRTWSGLTHLSPGYPAGGVYSAPIVAEPNGTLDVLYIGHPTNHSTLAVSPGHEFFTRSTDGGATWSKPVAVDAGVGSISLAEWWVDGSLAVDPAGTVYATWDTQGSSDTAWLAWSKNGGASWSAPVKVTQSSGENLVEVAVAGTGSVYVAWQTIVPQNGYATFARRFAVGKTWTGPAVRVSRAYGAPKYWPGDTFGIATDSHAHALFSWGSAVGGSALSQIWSAGVTLPS